MTISADSPSLVSIVVHCPPGEHFSADSVRRIAEGAAAVDPGKLTFELLLLVADSDAAAYPPEESGAHGIDRTLVRLPSSTSRGAAMCRGFEAARGEFVLVQDPQLAYSPTDYGSLLGPLLAAEADVVFGSRFAGHGATRVLHYWHSLRNRRLTTLSNMTTNLNLTDIEACQRAFRTDVVRGLTLREDGLAAEIELVARLAKVPEIRIFEVGIGYAADASEAEKRLSILGTLRAASLVLRYGLS